MDLQGILTRHEGKTLEFKRDLSSPRNLLRTLVAFANSAGGTIVIGVEDGSRAVRGVPDVLDAEERLASIVVDGVTPRLAPEIDIVSWRTLELLVVTVHPGPSRPYSVTAEGPVQGVYVRIGSTNRHGDEALTAELGRSARGESFDEMPFPDATVDDLDLTRIRELFRPTRSIEAKDLATLRLVAKQSGRQVPTTGGVLLFAKDRDQYFYGAGVRGARFKGTDRRTFIDVQDFAGTMPDQVEQAMDFVQRHISQRWEIAAARREVYWEYPLEAVREAIYNAVLHADYSQMGGSIRIYIYDDRIEVDNPGALLPGLTIAEVMAGTSRLRNRVIARVFRELGLSEQWGTGYQRMAAACRAAGLADPVLEELGSTFRVTLYGTRGSDVELDGIDRELVAALGGTDGLSTAALAKRVRKTPRTVRTRLARLVELGLVVEIGSGPNDPHRAYFVAEERGHYGR
jgi:ATP-dependent DNA helicase RecG